MKWLFLLIFFVGYVTQAQTPFYGRTTGPMVFINYGLGEDRLGGAKEGFLDSNILVKVTDSTKDVYKLQLSAQHTAWLPKTAFKKDSLFNPKPFYTTGNLKVTGTDTADYITAELPEKLPYRSLQQIDPSRIVVDVFGATSNTNWIIQLGTAREVANTWYEQPEDDVFRIYIQLKHPQHWGYSISYINNTLQIRVKRPPEALSLQGLHIAIDAGHGGSNVGAEGVTSHVAEKTYTLQFAKQLDSLLRERGAVVYMTRTIDTTLDMTERTIALRKEAPDLLISLHLNSSADPKTKGTGTFYRYIGFRPLTQAILRRMLQLGLAEYGNVGAFNFSLSGPTEFPNCLVEIAFLSNKDDEARIKTTAFQKAVAAQITAGIEDWLNSMK